MNDNWLIWVAFLMLVAALPLVRARDLESSLLPLVLWISAFYYAVAGPAYWLASEAGYFVGVDWSTTLPFAACLFSAAVLGYIAAYRLGLRVLKVRGLYQIRSSNQFARIPVINHLFLFLGLSSAAFVYGNSRSQGPLFLIAYQLSDVTVAAVIAGLACNLRSRAYWAAALLFSAYAVFAGFRYKLVLLWFPVWMLVLLGKTGWKRFLVLALPPIFGSIAFALIAVLRSKFSGVDLASLATLSSRVALYGLFSESNIIFGLSSILDSVVPAERYVYFQPLFDTFLELIPRALLPDRQTGTQIYMVLEGLYSLEGYNSATTYPFFGEYLMMGGYGAAAVGIFTVGLLSAWATKAVSKPAITRSLALGGVSLVAVLFGYYYVSRGYMPQFAKALICVYVPYLIVVRAARKSEMRRHYAGYRWYIPLPILRKLPR